MGADDRRHHLETIAYELWLRRGQPIGSPEIDWLEAERLYAQLSTACAMGELCILSTSLSQPTVEADPPSASIDIDAAPVSPDSVNQSYRRDKR